MKRLAALFFVLVLCLAVTACSGASDAVNSVSPDTLKDNALRFLEGRGAMLQENVVRSTGEVPQPLRLTHAMEYRLEDFEGYPVHCLLMRFEGGVGWENSLDDKVFVMVDLQTRNMYDSTMTDWADFDGSVTDSEDVPQLCINAYDSYTQGINAYLWSEHEICRVFPEEELPRLTALELPQQLHPAEQENAAPPMAVEETVPASFAPKAPVSADCGWNEQVLSQDEIQALMTADPDKVRDAISTVADARAYLDRRFPSLWMDAGAMNPDTGEVCYHAPWEHLEGIVADENGEPVLGRSDLCNIVMWLVEDDLPVGMLFAPYFESSGLMGPACAANYLRTTDGVVVFDPVLGMQGDAGSNYMDENLLPEAAAASLEDYVPLAVDANQGIWKIYAWEGAGRILMNRKEAPRTMEMLSPACEPLYHNPELDVPVTFADPENILSYALARELGGLTLTAEQARELVDAEPEVVREKVRTAADLLLYMLAANITDSFGDRTFWENGAEWHYNLNAFQVMEQRIGNCGASANLANYLLEGDYEEVGVILHAYYPGHGGGHVYNYFLHEGRYYIVDYSWYIFAGYAIENDFPVMKLSSLEEYGEKCHDLYGDVCLVLAHTTPGQHLPNIFDDANRQYVMPEGASFRVLYQSEDPAAYRAATAPVPAGVPDWKSYGTP